MKLEATQSPLEIGLTYAILLHNSALFYMTTCYIIRHAAKERGDFFNPDLRHQDEPISAQGRVDAQKLGSYFDGQSIAAIYVSEYRRTLQTSEPVARLLNLTPVIDARLNEIDRR